jgi:hypothetical protein
MGRDTEALLSEMEKETSTAQAISNFEQVPNEENHNDSFGDFVPPSDEEEEEDADFSELDEDPNEESLFDVLSPTESADVIVEIVNGVQTRIFTALLSRKRKAAFTDEQRVEIAQAKQQLETDVNAEEIGKEKLALLARHQAFEEKLDDLEFKDDESDRAKNTLAKYMKKHNKKIPADMGLWLVAAELFGKRVVDVFTA